MRMRSSSASRRLVASCSRSCAAAHSRQASRRSRIAWFIRPATSITSVQPETISVAEATTVPSPTVAATTTATGPAAATSADRRDRVLDTPSTPSSRGTITGPFA